MARQLDGGITWLGHATFLIHTGGGRRILIDPFVHSNPACPPEHQRIDELDLILCTHGHDDHIADVAQVAQHTGATVAGIVELCAHLDTLGIENLAPFNKGGTQHFGGVSVTMVNAFHSSSSTDGDGNVVYTGEPAGFVVTLENGYRIYHAGDTCVFGDMRIIGDLYEPDLALLPIGGHFTMDPREAAYAVELLGVREVIGMHYGTWPMLAGTPLQLREHVADDVTVHELQPGDTLGRIAAASRS